MSFLCGEQMDFFKAYDIRGKVPEEINPCFAKALGNAFACEFKLRSCCIGRDVRLSGASLCGALSEGLQDAGVNVCDLGECGSEEIYYASSLSEAGKPLFDGGVIVTASHNPSEYNGFKFVLGGAVPVSGDSGLFAMRERILNKQYFLAEQGKSRGQYTQASFIDSYIKHLLTYVDVDKIAPLKILADPGNGAAGAIVKLLAKQLPCEFIFINDKPDGSFPNGVPNPLLPAKRELTAKAVLDSGADLGLAWDGDFDRCFFYDAQGNFIEGYYLVGLLAQSFLLKNKKAGFSEKIIHDPRLTWNTIEIIKQAGGIAVENKTGHAFIKERMRQENAIYGGEMSAHHYFRNFSYCDSGMIPWLLVIELMSQSQRSLASLVAERIKAYPCSGEINRTVSDPQQVIAELKAVFQAKALSVSFVDGLSMEFNDWRFNVRSSKAEPLLRLNVESRANKILMEQRTAELLSLIDAYK